MSETDALFALEQALSNPRASTALNEWMDARLDAQVKKQLEPHFKEIDGRFKEIELKMNTEREFIDHLQRQVVHLEANNRQLEEKNQNLQDHLHKFLSTPFSFAGGTHKQ
jgi:chromosome segregation ATPase